MLCKGPRRAWLELGLGLGLGVGLELGVGVGLGVGIGVGLGVGLGVGVGVEGPRRAATAEVAADALARGAVELVGQQVLREIAPERGGAGVGWGEVNSGPTIGLQRAVREVAHGVGDQLRRRR